MIDSMATWPIANTLSIAALIVLAAVAAATLLIEHWYRQTGDEGHCPHCSWAPSDLSTLAAQAALTEHIRARHGGIP